MKLLLICAGGASTSILMKKMKKYADSKDMDFDVIAVGLSGYEDVYKDYDIIMLGPQVSYKKDIIKEATGKPVGIVAQLDYALGNAENIFKQMEQLT